MCEGPLLQNGTLCGSPPSLSLLSCGPYIRVKNERIKAHPDGRLGEVKAAAAYSKETFISGTSETTYILEKDEGGPLSMPLMWKGYAKGG